MPLWWSRATPRIHAPSLVRCVLFQPLSSRVAFACLLNRAHMNARSHSHSHTRACIRVRTRTPDAYQVRPWSGEALEPLRRLLRKLDPLTAADAVDRLSFADLRDRLLSFAPLDVAHVKRVNAAEAEFWRATEGVTQIGASDEVCLASAAWRSGFVHRLNTVTVPSVKESSHFDSARDVCWGCC